MQKNEFSKRLGLFIGLTYVDEMDYDGWDGECPGCDIDVNYTYDLACRHGVYAFKMENSFATIANFKNVALDLIGMMTPNSNDLLCLYYSGHGGQQPDQNGDELDGKDETLCLWDGEIIDDDIGIILDKVPEGCRVFMISDSCNSDTNYRLRGLNVERSTPINIEKVIPPTFKAGLIHYAGCADGRSSLGTDEGGLFTLALKETFKFGITYKDWFNKAKKLMPRNQKPYYRELGNVTDDFRNAEVWY